jgi:hypothetical protein
MERFVSIYKDIYKVDPDEQELAQFAGRLSDPGKIDWERLKSIMEQHPQSGKAEQVSVGSLLDAYDAYPKLDESVVWLKQVPHPVPMAAVKIQLQEGEITGDVVEMPNLKFRWEFPNGCGPDEATLKGAGFVASGHPVFTMDSRAFLEREGYKLEIVTEKGNVPVGPEVATVVKHPSTTVQDAVQNYIKQFGDAGDGPSTKVVIIVDQASDVYTPYVTLAEEREHFERIWAELLSASGEAEQSTAGSELAALITEGGTGAEPESRVLLVGQSGSVGAESLDATVG